MYKALAYGSHLTFCHSLPLCLCTAFSVPHTHTHSCRRVFALPAPSICHAVFCWTLLGWFLLITVTGLKCYFREIFPNHQSKASSQARCGSVTWAWCHKAKDHWFDSWLGHMPGLGTRFPVRGVWEAPHQFFSHKSTFLSFPFSLLSLLSKNK